jgi:hypothetical protein
LEKEVTLFYPDCSNNNWSSAQDAINFLEQLVPEGFSGMCHKVSEGNYYEDPYWPTIQQWCAGNNLPLIGYHYVPPDDPASQAQTWHGNNGGALAGLANGVVSSAYPDGAGYASTIYANSGGDSGGGWAPYGGITPAAWQFTDQADVAGVRVDCNAYPGPDITTLFGAASSPSPIDSGTAKD